MKNIDINSYVEEEINKFESLSEEEQLAKQAEYVGTLIEMLPDPNNEQEFQEFVKLYKNPPITGNTEEERTLSFLELSKTNPKFFSQCIALSSLSMNLSSLEEVAKENANNVPKQASVQAISKEDILAEMKKETQERLSNISIDE